MGTIVGLKPNANVSGSGGFTVTGTANAYTALSDSSDSTYITATSAGKTLVEALGTTTLAAGTQVKRARFYARARAVTGGGLGTAYGLSFSIGGTTTSLAYQGSTGSIADKYGSWVNVAGQSGNTPSTWPTQTDIDNATLTVREGSTTLTRVYEAWLQLDIIDQPTVTVSTPSTATTLPDVAWTYADGDGDPQTYYEVKVFDSATYSGGGFSADTSTPTWTSGQVASEAASTTVGTALVNGTAYRAYVRVGHDGGVATYWSAWAYAGWTVSVTPPTTPTVSLSWSSFTSRVTATVTGAALPGGLVSQTYQLQASADAGATWEDVRDATALVPNGSYVATGYDYEATRAVTMSYRARSRGVDSGGGDVSTAWSTTATVITSNDLLWWFKPISNLSASMGGVAVIENPEVAIEETLSVNRPLGATSAVVVAGDEYGEDGAFVIDCRDSEITTFRPIARHQGAILVQDPFGGHRYIRWTGRGRVIQGTPDAPRTRWSMSYVEVARPAVT